MCQEWLSDQNLRPDESELVCGDFDEAVATVPFSSDADSLNAERVASNTMSETATSEEHDVAAIRRCFSSDSTDLWELQLRDDVMAAASYLPQESRELRIQNLARLLQSIGYGVYIINGSSFGCMTRKFLIVFDARRCTNFGQEKSQTGHALVDLDFRDIFEIPRASFSYNRLLSLLPQIIIAPYATTLVSAFRKRAV
ncbi:hypothetical protein CYMTET_41755 [Cymbomonas tetramitiformis]|uniref:Uncharacterized protein n=1 Tax=Cymbomonas tetramitiformis TaxID=36881 RepID=A0AAE0C6T7_9CHLO|nr:hypothetical protein CYMTET_41755 [Cymbomonas tetramitiformis]